MRLKAEELEENEGGDLVFEETRRTQNKAANVSGADSEQDLEVQSEQDVAPDIPAEYKPAETWDGLSHLGHLGDWRDMEPTPKDEYKGYALLKLF